VETYEIAMDALAEPTRRAILDRLRDGERSVGAIAEGLPVTRPAVSQHLAVLRRAGLVTDRAEGTRRIYRLNPEGVGRLRAYVDDLWDRALARFAEAAEREEERMSPEPVRKSITVDASPETAFRVFTDLGSWWPLGEFSIAVDDPLPGEEGQTPEDAVIEPRAGGRIYERMADGREWDWGSVTEYDPPRRLVLAWAPVRVVRPATTVEVTFTPLQDGRGTRVDLVHSGFEVSADDPAALREQYDRGWPGVLARFGAQAAAAE
jgi:DNA-binding transcriptional ArsR family regulator/uncharacterized protein YndB with AHSA1/START domain